MTAGESLAAQLVGTWRLVSLEARSSSGEVEHPWGESVDGRLAYDAAGNMSMQIARPTRQPFASDDLEGGTLEEIEAAFDTYHAYYGRYRVDEAASTVTHDVEASLFPNWVGGGQTRFLRLQAGRLTLTSPPLPFSGRELRFVTVWERLG